MAYYGTVEDGDIYFAQLRGRTEWKTATSTEKLQVLFEATQAIDMFNYIGCKTSESQELQFPRNGETTVPRDIVYATFEEAYQLLCDRDSDEELRELRVQQRRFGQVQTQYMPGVKPASNVTAGILSSKAWRLISQYFRQVTEIQIVRV